VKQKLVWQRNRIIDFSNSAAELLCGEADLNFMKWSSPKQVLNKQCFFYWGDFRWYTPNQPYTWTVFHLLRRFCMIHAKSTFSTRTRLYFTYILFFFSSLVGCLDWLNYPCFFLPRDYKPTSAHFFFSLSLPLPSPHESKVQDDLPDKCSYKFNRNFEPLPLSRSNELSHVVYNHSCWWTPQKLVKRTIFCLNFVFWICSDQKPV
jgi:hypothetical protein